MCRNGQLPKELLCLSQLLLLLILSSLGGGLFLLLFGNSFSLLFLFSCLLLGLLPLQFDALSLLLLSQALLLLPLPFALATETRISGHRPLHQQGNPRDLLPLESLGLAIDLLGHPALLVTRIGHLHVVIGGLRRLKGEVSPRIEVSPVIVEGVNLVYWGRIVTKRGRGVVLILVAVSVVVASAAPLFLRLLLLRPTFALRRLRGGGISSHGRIVSPIEAQIAFKHGTVRLVELGRTFIPRRYRIIKVKSGIIALLLGRIRQRFEGSLDG
mmetsp:Transcript_34798/g.75463  ORF Transcript_34798/g.75463 Transcript_34798/m.75463 type:complete len:270 (-) Transcript_34798:552-1361(-)